MAKSDKNYGGLGRYKPAFREKVDRIVGEPTQVGFLRRDVKGPFYRPAELALREDLAKLFRAIVAPEVVDPETLKQYITFGEAVIHLAYGKLAHEERARVLFGPRTTPTRVAELVLAEVSTGVLPDRIVPIGDVMVAIADLSGQENSKQETNGVDPATPYTLPLRTSGSTSGEQQPSSIQQGGQ